MIRRLRKRDRGFVLLVVVHLVCIAGFIVGDRGSAASELGGWRRIDLPALLDKIRSGDLVEHEADWYRTVPGDAASAGPAASGAP